MLWSKLYNVVFSFIQWRRYLERPILWQKKNPIAPFAFEGNRHNSRLQLVQMTQWSKKHVSHSLWWKKIYWSTFKRKYITLHPQMFLSSLYCQLSNTGRSGLSSQYPHLLGKNKFTLAAQPGITSKFIKIHRRCLKCWMVKRVVICVLSLWVFVYF